MSPEPAGGWMIEDDPHTFDETHGCAIALRRIGGPAAGELFLHCQPPAGVPEAGRQAEAIYRAVLGVLEAAGGTFGSVVTETIFLRDLRTNIDAVRAARERALATCEAHMQGPATTTIELPPVNEQACLEVSVHAVLPSESSPRFESIETRPPCGCAECARARGLRIHVGEETRFYAGGLCAPGEDAYEQTLALFGFAEDLLQRACMTFGDVVRTWIYLREIDRDYRDLNRARRVFFEDRGIELVPASTGIGGGPVSDAHDLCLSLYAVKAGGQPLRTVMTSPTLNEAMHYGADFARGMRLEEANKIALHVSGTASIDERGRTAHRGDFEAQAQRMLVNVAALLEGQGANFDDVVSAVTYLKRPADAARLEAKLREAGFAGFPHALVVAPICRPELLCETEVLAVLPKNAPAPGRGGLA